MNMFCRTAAVVCITLLPASARFAAADEQEPRRAAFPLLKLEGNEWRLWTTADAPLEHPAPWGEPQDGLACRLLLNEEYCDGEPIRAVLELRNASQHDITLPTVFDIEAKNLATLEVVGPAGKKLPLPRADAWDMDNFGPQRFHVLKPGAVWQVQFPDLRRNEQAGLPHVATEFAAHGEYALTYGYFGASQLRGVPAKAREQLAHAWKGTLVSNTATIKRRPLEDDDLAVHEWGVFSVTGDLEYANAGRKAEWESMPEFFYRQFPHWRLRWIPSAWDKPIVYFYTPREHLTLDVEVDFPKGAPVVWWPSCSKPFDDTPGRRPRPIKTGPLFRSLAWNVWLGESFPMTAGDRPVGGYRPVRLYPAPKDSWLPVARDVPDAATVSTWGTNLTGRAPWIADELESERFIYYDGLVPTPNYLRCLNADAQAVLLKNAAQFPLGDLFVVQRGEDARVRFAHVPELKAGAQLKLQPAVVPADGWPATGRRAVRRALRRAGLFKAEVAALLDLWSEKFFNAPGLTAFYLLPRSEYDRMLPLQITPRPRRVVRVGVALHAQLQDEPEVRKRVGQLIAELDDDNFRRREAAAKELTGLGPPAFAMLREAMQSSKSFEVKDRCRRILENFDATVYLERAAREAERKRIAEKAE